MAGGETETGGRGLGFGAQVEGCSLLKKEPKKLLIRLSLAAAALRRLSPRLVADKGQQAINQRQRGLILAERHGNGPVCVARNAATQYRGAWHGNFHRRA